MEYALILTFVCCVMVFAAAMEGTVSIPFAIAFFMPIAAVLGEGGRITAVLWESLPAVLGFAVWAEAADILRYQEPDRNRRTREDGRTEAAIAVGAGGAAAVLWYLRLTPSWLVPFAAFLMPFLFATGRTGTAAGGMASVLELPTCKYGWLPSTMVLLIVVLRIVQPGIR